jgi:hypothetical protein
MSKMNNHTMNQPTPQAVTGLIDKADLYRYRNGVQPKVIIYFNSGEPATPWFVAMHDGVCVSRIIEMCATKAQALKVHTAMSDPALAQWQADGSPRCGSTWESDYSSVYPAEQRYGYIGE